MVSVNVPAIVVLNYRSELLAPAIIYENLQSNFVTDVLVENSDEGHCRNRFLNWRPSRA